MTKLFRFLILAILMIAAVFPASAQYDQDDIDKAECVHLEFTLGATGEYIFVFLYQDEFNELLNGGIITDITIQVDEPGTVFVYNIIVPPQTLLLIATPRGFFEVVNFENGEVFSFGFGSIIGRSGDMNTECLGAATDGRINRFDQQMLAVIYADGNGGYDVWAVDPASSNGTFDYNVSRAEVDAGLSAAGASWQVIGSGSTSSFYAAADGQCVLTSPNAGGEMQTFVFACAAE